MWKQVVLLLVFTVVVPRIYRHIVFQGYHTHQFNHYPGPCRRLPKIENGSEDIELLHDGKVLITSGVVLGPAYAGVKGRMYSFDLGQPARPPLDVAITGSLDLQTFHPAGLTSWKDDITGELLIYVVNINIRGTFVEIFEYMEEQSTLLHLETVHDPLFTSVNNLVATGRRQFYFTNIYNKLGPWEMTLELYWANAGYYDGEKAVIVADGMIMANGIAMSPDKRYIYISHIYGQEVRIYRRKDDNSLTFSKAYDVHMTIDKLFVDKNTGDVWGAGTNKKHLLFKYVDAPKEVKSPTQVVRLGVKDGNVTSMASMFADDGALHSGGSVAIYANNKLLLGSISSSTTMCDVKYV